MREWTSDEHRTLLLKPSEDISVNKKVKWQIGASILVFILVAWFINTTAQTIDWENTLLLRIGALVLVSLVLMWNGTRKGGLGTTVNSKWVWWVVGLSAAVLLFIYGVKPWMDEQLTRSRDTAVARRVQNENVQKSAVTAIVDRNDTLTVWSWYHISIPSFLTRTLVGPVDGNASYAVRYPTANGDTVVVNRWAGQPHVELPGGLKWMEISPLDADSVLMAIQQHTPR